MRRILDPTINGEPLGAVEKVVDHLVPVSDESTSL